MADKTYEVKGRTIRLQIDDAMVAIRFKENLQTSRRAAAVERPGVEAFSRRLELPREPFTVLPLTRLEGARSAAEEAEELAANDDVVRVTPVFKIGDKHAIATERLSLGLKEGQDPAVMADIKRTYDLETLEEFGDREFMMRVPPGEDPVDVAARLGGDDRIDYAEPDLVIFGTHVPRPPSASNGADPTMTGRGPRRFSAGDPLLAHQYAIPITETDLAWRMARGASDIRIAILDEGVDTDHPDLKEAIVGSYDAIDNDEWQEPQPWDAHGTACAGLAAAVRDNGIGIAGVGAGCSILAVRIAYSNHKGGPWLTSDSAIRRAIDWSWRAGADILSNSWGGGAYSVAIENAFRRAATQGRGGKGAVVLVAAGNASGPVDFPGYLDGVLTVSASNEYDEFKTRTSLDGETWWGSNFGPEVDVAAPGVHNLTTDIAGADGYEPGDYADFNGTSSATPIVAGACGLILSAAPELREHEVRAIIGDTADKVGQFPYSGGRNDQMGNGRLNVRRAVEQAVSTLTN